MPRIALLCSGLGHIRRGHEVFARGLFDLLRDAMDITLFKGGGEAAKREFVVPNIPRESELLRHLHVVASPRWRAAAADIERLRIEGETFAWGALGELLAGDFDVIHCLEQEVVAVLYRQRHLFRNTPKFLWSNGGALPAADIPPCDFVQEHSAYNLKRSLRNKAFVIPHGVDTTRFCPGIRSDFRARHGIPPDAFVVISVGAIGYWHKRMDHVVREVASVPGTWLVVVGQETADTPAIKSLATQVAPGRTIFVTLPHEELPAALVAADVFALGSLFETFGIAYIEAMAAGLPVVCTNHPNQREIVREGVFVDMARNGALTEVLARTPRERWREIGLACREVALARYDLAKLRHSYLEWYARIASSTVSIPRFGLRHRVAANVRNLTRGVRRLFPR